MEVRQCVYRNCCGGLLRNCRIFDPEITFITDDSRKVKPGCAFVCIRGNHIDGHTLAVKAVESGAAAVIAQADTGLFLPSARARYEAAYSLMCEALFHDPAQRLHLIGITGTNGKTTSAFLIKEVLDAAGYRTGLIGTVQNMAGDEVFPAQLTTPDPYELKRALPKDGNGGLYALCDGGFFPGARTAAGGGAAL